MKQLRLGVVNRGESLRAGVEYPGCTLLNKTWLWRVRKLFMDGPWDSRTETLDYWQIDDRLGKTGVSERI